jgi:hypothetical protein
MVAGNGFKGSIDMVFQISDAHVLETVNLIHSKGARHVKLAHSIYLNTR